MEIIIITGIIVFYVAIIILGLIIPVLKISKYKQIHNIRNPYQIYLLKRRVRNAFFKDLNMFDELLNQFRYALYAEKKYKEFNIKMQGRFAFVSVEDHYFVNPFTDTVSTLLPFDQEHKIYDRNFSLYYNLIKDNSLNVDEVLFKAKRPSTRCNEVYIFILYSLINGDITQFISLYEEYQDNKKNRYESLILNEEMATITLCDKEFSIALEIVDDLYRFYSKNEYIEKELEEFSPKNNLEKIVFHKIIKKYYEHTEQDHLIDQLDD